MDKEQIDIDRLDKARRIEIGKMLARVWIPTVEECQVCACRDCIKRPCPRCDDCDAPLVVCPDASLKPSAETRRLLLEEVGR